MPAIFSCKSTILRDSKINEFYLLAYLNSNFGRKLLLRKTRGAVQAGLNLDDLKTLTIPCLSDDIQFEVEKLVKNANYQLDLSQSSYKDAENLLLDELGLLNWQPTEQNTSVVSFADSFFTTGRLDAEYYQPKYEEIESKIKSYKNGFGVLGKLTQYVYTGEYADEYLPKSKDLKFYIRSTNIKNGLVEEDENYYVESYKFTKFAKKGDIITARVGTIGIFGGINEEIEGSVYSDNVLCFRLPESFNYLAYTVYFNSRANWELVDRLARGSVQQRLNQETLKDLVVPILTSTIQENIVSLINKSQFAKSESKRLLNLAKKAVEAAIEQDEETALDLITEDQPNA
ncbi:MAG: restriction endonuclease subunit S [Acidobacteriota bacterium]|nr:restriction endonuclease subunit S [Acidobacteriota bacterium]